MNVTPEVIELIKRAEGFRARAYRDATGILTIGYGHTSMAGPPRVTEGAMLSQAAAETILAADIERFSDGLRPLIKRRLTDSQFSALVSFAYNVGLANVARSSVLAAVNAGDFDAVPRRLALWVKAGGRTLPGLVKRRAEEGAMFTSAGANVSVPDVPSHKPVYRSRTLLAALIVIAAAMGQALFAAASAASWIAIAVIAAAAALIIFERLKKLKQEGI
jgi:lysozyme